jgi:hypothetical protein
LLSAGQPLGEGVRRSGGLGRVPARELDGFLGGVGEPLDGGLRLADGGRGVAHLLRRGEQLGRVDRSRGGARAQLGQLLAQVAEQAARLLVANRLDLDLLDARAEPLHQRARLVQLAPQALALDGVVRQLADALPQLVELTAQSALALAAVPLRGQRLLQRFELRTGGGVLVGQVAAVLLAGVLDLLQPRPGLGQLLDEGVSGVRALPGQLLEPLAREAELHLEHLAVGGQRALELLDPCACLGHLDLEPGALFAELGLDP